MGSPLLSCLFARAQGWLKLPRLSMSASASCDGWDDVALATLVTTSRTGGKRKSKGRDAAAAAIQAGGAARMELIAKYEQIKKPAKAYKGPLKVPPLPFLQAPSALPARPVVCT